MPGAPLRTSAVSIAKYAAAIRNRPANQAADRALSGHSVPRPWRALQAALGRARAPPSMSQAWRGQSKPSARNRSRRNGSRRRGRGLNSGSQREWLTGAAVAGRTLRLKARKPILKSPIEALAETLPTFVSWSPFGSPGCRPRVCKGSNSCPSPPHAGRQVAPEADSGRGAFLSLSDGKSHEIHVQ